jgi:hypothetical protein
MDHLSTSAATAKVELRQMFGRDILAWAEDYASDPVVAEALARARASGEAFDAALENLFLATDAAREARRQAEAADAAVDEVALAVTRIWRNAQSAAKRVARAEAIAANHPDMDLSGEIAKFSALAEAALDEDMRLDQAEAGRVAAADEERANILRAAEEAARGR